MRLSMRMIYIATRCIACCVYSVKSAGLDDVTARKLKFPDLGKFYMY